MSHKHELYRESFGGKFPTKKNSSQRFQNKHQPTSYPSKHNNIKKVLSVPSSDKEFNPNDIFTEHSETFDETLDKVSANTVDTRQKILLMESQIAHLEKCILTLTSEINSIKQNQLNTNEMLNLVSNELANAKSRIVR